MKYRILRPFDYSTDGVTSIPMVPGADEDIRADLAPGLLAEHYIGPAGEGVEGAFEERPDGSETGEVAGGFMEPSVDETELEALPAPEDVGGGEEAAAKPVAPAAKRTFSKKRGR